jgi:hypothetical protein
MKGMWAACSPRTVSTTPDIKSVYRSRSLRVSSAKCLDQLLRNSTTIFSAPGIRCTLSAYSAPPDMLAIHTCRKSGDLGSCFRREGEFVKPTRLLIVT